MIMMGLTCHKFVTSVEQQMVQLKIWQEQECADKYYWLTVFVPNHSWLLVRPLVQGARLSLRVRFDRNNL